MSARKEICRPRRGPKRRFAAPPGTERAGETWTALNWLLRETSARVAATPSGRRGSGATCDRLRGAVGLTPVRKLRVASAGCRWQCKRHATAGDTLEVRRGCATRARRPALVFPHRTRGVARIALCTRARTTPRDSIGLVGPAATSPQSRRAVSALGRDNQRSQSNQNRGDATNTNRREGTARRDRRCRS